MLDNRACGTKVKPSYSTLLYCWIEYVHEALKMGYSQHVEFHKC